MSRGREGAEADVIAALRRKRESLAKEKDNLTRNYYADLAKVDSMILALDAVIVDEVAKLTNATGAAPLDGVSGGPPPGYQGGSTRERIANLLLEVGEPTAMAEIVDAVRKGGSTARADTIRDVLLQMRQVGQVLRVRRGVYELTAAGRAAARWSRSA